MRHLPGGVPGHRGNRMVLPARRLRRAVQVRMTMMIRTLIAALLVATPALATPALADPTVFAAASTGRALDAAIAASGQSVITSYGASGTLARQVEQGAPVDLYLSANPKWMAFLVDAGIVRQEDVVVLMSNNLVLIAPEGAGPFDPDHIADFLGDGLFAMGDPDVAPVGRYGQAALTSLGLWDQVATALVPTRNTTATVAAVASQDASLGLVYASDAAAQAGIEVVWAIPADSHPPISYLIVPVAQGEDPDGAQAFLGYLQGDAGQDILAQAGFLVREGE
ncbi:MAG: molybdate ABC transporter substrate-binding protein [Rhodobacteraceae bacterium]|nr:molybdate ABC transporter substrate-binding protein [Paracoccaceae bacterium]